MLTTDDKRFIQESIKAGFQEFYESVFEPYATRNEKAHRKLDIKIEKIDKNMNARLRELRDNMREFIKDYEKRIRNLEVRSDL